MTSFASSVKLQQNLSPNTWNMRKTWSSEQFYDHFWRSSMSAEKRGTVVANNFTITILRSTWSSEQFYDHFWRSSMSVEKRSTVENSELRRLREIEVLFS